jgi:Mg-chelatase subunit ChlD
MQILAGVLLAAAINPVPVQRAPERHVASAVGQQRPRVEVTFVLDTTGSMGGLLEGAKRKIWSIARAIGEGRPRPELRVALVGYRDQGDAYVTRVHDFSADMDAVYANLSAFEAGGGGDWPEHVSRALSDAVHRVSWSQDRALRIIFLVGDAPPQTQYQDGYDYRRHVREARQRGIVLEAIQCGGATDTAVAWRDIASLGAGHYAQIDAQGGMPARITPVDAELASINAELSRTVVAGGSIAEQVASKARLDTRAAMAAPAAAEAAGYFAAADKLADKDLVDLPVAEQKRELGALRANAAAPKPLAGKSDAEALAFLKKQKDERTRLQSRVTTLQRQREAFLAKEGAAPRDGFDAQVLQALKVQAKPYGIVY